MSTTKRLEQPTRAIARARGGMPSGRTLDAPSARAALVRGVDQMTALVRPTLGPLPRTVVIAGQFPTDAPEVLDHAATILRRTIQIADPFADMGAMLIRHLAWSVFQRVGDGAATAVTLAHAMIHEGAIRIAAGADPNAIRRGMERSLAVAVAALREQARLVDSPADLAGCIAGIVRDPGMARMIGEAVDSVGADGAVLVEDWQGISVTVDYLDGVRWKSGLLSPYLLAASETAGRLHEARIFLTDQPVVSERDLLPVLEVCVAGNERRLLIVAPEIGAAALGLLIANRDRGVLESALAVRAPGDDAERAAILEDLAVVTGGRALLAATGMPLASVSLADLGRARQVWATADTFGILGGRGERAAIRHRIGALKQELRAMASGDERARTRLRERIGKLAGTAAVIMIGAPTEAARIELRSRVEAAARAALAALEEGAVAGGGAALRACVPAVERLAATMPGEESLGARLLARALSAPMRVIAMNAGYEPSVLSMAAFACDGDRTFDVLRGRWVDAWEAGILDPLAVTVAALESSVSAATMALTTEVLVRRSHPPQASEP